MNEFSDLVFQAVGFEWDESNSEKNWRKHGVRPTECEEVFLRTPLLVEDDSRHSDDESRYVVLGQTEAGRPLFVVFTLRDNLIRVISARDMSRRERRSYAKAEAQTDS